MTDALGNKIELGKIYGYSNRNAGFVTVIVGEAIKIDEKGVHLNVIGRGKAVYSDKIKSIKIKRNIIALTANSIFPISDIDIMWLKDE